MLRSLMVMASLLGCQIASGCASASRGSSTQDASNIGVVLYTKGDSAGTLNARWMYTTAYSGPGVATGGPAEGFAGQYHIRYFLASGEFSDEYDLVIKKVGDFYEVSWIVDGTVRAAGVGMEVDEGLAVGWHKVAD
jgi:hypothetical protein